MSELTNEQKDILGEIANISMGNAATNLSMMVNNPVNITTPGVSIISRSNALDDYQNTCIFVQIHYVKGLDGNNVFILQEPDVIAITDLMMGGPGNSEGEVDDMHMSAISEAMNQMMGASASSLATLLDRMVDISPPDVCKIDVDSVKVFEKIFDSNTEQFVKVAFKMDIGDLIHSTMVQLYPIPFAVEMCDKFSIKKKAGQYG
ncbi:flagellar motor switch protein FliN/FliY [Oribacterium sp. KHPX15]|uniref:flagellar motor switch phosphatase FliY n=1 Tax=Oribacterium sp. KHPX15 TaxID=1855342 RepID=UPI00089D2152|nr:flagellar motor switch phosphatase FliY [Oribacterium sp. KHPX15]SEA26574.1 flagellar motor switch protein FliN/FliY [Oribacterium sp. KHPX15]